MVHEFVFSVQNVQQVATSLLIRDVDHFLEMAVQVLQKHGVRYKTKTKNFSILNATKKELELMKNCK